MDHDLEVKINRAVDWLADIIAESGMKEETKIQLVQCRAFLQKVVRPQIEVPVMDDIDGTQDNGQ